MTEPADSDGVTETHKRRRCRVRGFLEPSLDVVALSYSDRPYFLNQPRVSGSLLGRFRGGAHFDDCLERIDVRVAASLLMTNLPNLADQYGFGLDVEVGLPLVKNWSLGPRLGVETPRTTVHLTAGARLRYKRAYWFGVDIFHSRATKDASLTYFPRCTDEEVSGCVANITAVTLGAGYGGVPGAVTVGVAGVLVLLALAAYAGSGR